MAPSPGDSPQTPAPVPSARARDRGLRRSRRTTLWIAATAAAGAAALGGAYTHLLPGGQATPAPSNAPIHSPSASTAGTSGSGKDDEGREGSNGHESDEDDDEEGEAPATQPAPQPPAQPPAATRQQPHTTTGAS
ncbi:hypothetical protein [Streptomyces neyagawaensis]|uniref:hypothetical protein n=1 Tax=Streptomyces neyagawaensis TaxID=42238 RepID=UPI00201D2342|nr:hypothetical protein [Streptomyces neyagawaensis]MCL6735144.1 hypothetical protein [Streptomyces neyagawaensis]MDE1687539.1 hypothetical protein [Streptomyces neyagawaensis]